MPVNQPWPCPLCKCTFGTAMELADHMLILGQCTVRPAMARSAPNSHRTSLDNGLHCRRCGAAHYLDTVIPGDAWNAIEGDKFGILCAPCIDTLLAEKGLMCEAKFYFIGNALRSKFYPEDYQDGTMKPKPALCENRLAKIASGLYWNAYWPVRLHGDDPATHEAGIATIHAAIENIVRECAQIAEDKYECNAAMILKPFGLTEKP